MKRIFSKTLLLLLCISIFISSSNTVICAKVPSVPDTSFAENVSLYNVNTDKVIYSKNSASKLFPSSAVKMMTGLIACEMLVDRLDETVTVTETMIGDAYGLSARLEVGMSVTVEDLLYGLLCGCGNDAALAVATLCSGSVKAFVAEMNAKATELKMKNTFFTNPTGLDDKKMYSTLSDIMILAKEAANNKLYLEISSSMSYVFTPDGWQEEIKLFNRNSLISNFYALGYRNQYAYGLIAGNTELGGYCTITYAEKNGTGYICAVMNAQENDGVIYSYDIVNSLLDYAFDNYSYVKIAEKGIQICTAKTKFALPSSDEEVTVSCVMKDDVYALTYMDIDVKNDIEYKYYLHNDTLSAPIYEGAIVGGVDIVYQEEVIGSGALIAAEDVPASGMLLRLEGFRAFFLGRMFWLSIIFSTVGIFLYFRISYIKNRNGKRKKKNVKKFY